MLELLLAYSFFYQSNLVGPVEASRWTEHMPRRSWTRVLAPFVQVPHQTQNRPQFPSTATSCRLSALDSSDNVMMQRYDYHWQCACNAVEQTMRHVPTYSKAQRAMEEESIFAAVSRVAERVRATGFPLCQQGRVFNPYAAPGSTECSHHLPIFELFPPVGAASGPARPANSSAHEYVREWLGNIRPWDWDCVPNTYSTPYAANVPSRAVDCLRGDPSQGVDLPLVDEEYFELADAMLAVASADVGGRFVVVEVGARNAPWAVRAMTAARALGRSCSWFAVLVEPMASHAKWIRDHFAMNGFGPETYRVISRPFGHGGVSLSETLRGLEHVDFLDIDAQRGEAQLVQSAADAEALRRVRRVHIEGHGDAISLAVIATLQQQGFNTLRNASARIYDVYNSSVIGRVQFRGASIYAANRNASNTMRGGC